MASPPSPLNLRIEDLGDVPEWGRMLVERLNEHASEVAAALSGGITRENLAATEKLQVTFTTKASAADTFPIKVAHGLPAPPKHVACTIARADGAAITSAWSMTSTNASEGQALVTFQGLSNSTKYRVNFTFE